MPSSKIITGQKIDPDKYKRAVELRKEMTPAEKILWERLKASRLNGFHFRRQQIITGFIVDFYCHSARLIIEIDGPVHNIQKEYDAEREKVLEDRGFCILRFSNQDVVENIEDVVVKIRGNLTPEPRLPLQPEAGSQKGRGNSGSSPLPFREGGTEGE